MSSLEAVERAKPFISKSDARPESYEPFKAEIIALRASLCEIDSRQEDFATSFFSYEASAKKTDALFKEWSAKLEPETRLLAEKKGHIADAYERVAALTISSKIDEVLSDIVNLFEKHRMIEKANQLLSTLLNSPLCKETFRQCKTAIERCDCSLEDEQKIDLLDKEYDEAVNALSELQPKLRTLDPLLVEQIQKFYLDLFQFIDHAVDTIAKSDAMFLTIPKVQNLQFDLSQSINELLEKITERRTEAIDLDQIAEKQSFLDALTDFSHDAEKVDLKKSMRFSNIYKYISKLLKNTAYKHIRPTINKMEKVAKHLWLFEQRIQDRIELLHAGNLSPLNPSLGSLENERKYYEVLLHAQENLLTELVKELHANREIKEGIFYATRLSATISSCKALLDRFGQLIEDDNLQFLKAKEALKVYLSGQITSKSSMQCSDVHNLFKACKAVSALQSLPQDSDLSITEWRKRLKRVYREALAKKGGEILPTPTGEPLVEILALDEDPSLLPQNVLIALVSEMTRWLYFHNGQNSPEELLKRYENGQEFQKSYQKEAALKEIYDEYIGILKGFPIPENVKIDLQKICEKLSKAYVKMSLEALFHYSEAAFALQVYKDSHDRRLKSLIQACDTAKAAWQQKYGIPDLIHGKVTIGQSDVSQALYTLLSRILWGSEKVKKEATLQFQSLDPSFFYDLPKEILWLYYAVILRQQNDSVSKNEALALYLESDEFAKLMHEKPGIVTCELQLFKANQDLVQMKKIRGEKGYALWKEAYELFDKLLENLTGIQEVPQTIQKNVEEIRNKAIVQVGWETEEKGGKYQAAIMACLSHITSLLTALGTA